MPEILRSRDAYKGILQGLKKQPDPWNDSYKYFINLENRGIILGHGGEHFVVDAPKAENKVYAICHQYERTGRTAKEIYYTHKIFSTLFPYNFPRVYASFGIERTGDIWNNRKPEEVAGTVREKIFPQHGRERRSHSFRKVEKFCKKYMPQVHFDVHDGNFHVGQDRGKYYLDKIYLNKENAVSEEAVVKWMNGHNVYDKKTSKKRPYSDQEKREVANAIKRLKVLNY